MVDLAAVAPEVLLDALKDKTLVTHNGTFDLGVLRSRYGYTHEGQGPGRPAAVHPPPYAARGDRTKPDKGCGSCRILGTPRWISTARKKDVGMTSLASRAHKYLGRLMDKGAQKSDWSRATLSKEQVRYALEDTSVLLELVEVLTSELHDLWAWGR